MNGNQRVSMYDRREVLPDEPTGTISAKRFIVASAIIRSDDSELNVGWDSVRAIDDTEDHVFCNERVGEFLFAVPIVLRMPDIPLGIDYDTDQDHYRVVAECRIERIEKADPAGG